MSDLDIKGLFLKHASAVQSFLLRRSNDSQLAADLTQESFLRLAEQGEDGRIDNSPAYLYRTARNLLIDHQRQQLRRKTDLLADEQLAEIVDAGASVEDIAAAREGVGALQQVLAQLPERTQQIFQLNRIEGLTHAEVARELGISDSSVQKHLAKALAHVMAHLEGVGEQ